MVGEESSNKQFLNDVHSGSMAYNRLDFQISQAIHMILKDYRNTDFVVIMDFEDDLTFYPDSHTE